MEELGDPVDASVTHDERPRQASGSPSASQSARASADPDMCRSCRSAFGRWHSSRRAFQSRAGATDGSAGTTPLGRRSGW
jgi:hypothetical protein